MYFVTVYEKVTVHERKSLLRKSKLYIQLTSHFGATPPAANGTEEPAPTPLLSVLTPAPLLCWTICLDASLNRETTDSLIHQHIRSSDAPSTTSSLRLEVTARTSWPALLRASSSSHCDGLGGCSTDLSRRDLSEDTGDSDWVESESAEHG